MGKKKDEDIPAVCFSLRKSLHCKSEPSDVHDPTAEKQLGGTILNRKPARSGCSKSIANLKDVVIHGSKRHLEQPPNCSPRSIGSTDFFNPITHDVIFNTSKCELKITASACGFNGHDGGGTLSPGTRFNNIPYPLRNNSATPPRRKEGFGKESNYGVTCNKCGHHFAKLEAMESHHLSKHAVTELVEGDSSRKIVEIICRSSWMTISTKPKNNNNNFVRIDKILKVHNTPRTLSRFEDYREAVKARASKLPKKHPRCLADGNELLRFHGTYLACSLGSTNGSSGLCIFDGCNACRIIRHGWGVARGTMGVFTVSTSERAYKSIPVECDRDHNHQTSRKALVVCRVIAGRVHRPVENAAEIGALTGFDSLAGKVGPYSNVEELFLLNPKALLPCFVVICKPPIV